MNGQQLKANKGPASGGSNLANSNPLLKQRVEDIISKEDKRPTVNAVTASGSGLDPDISISNAHAQVKRIAEARNIKASTVEQIIQQYKQSSPMTEDYVNVLKMNLALDKVK